MAASDVPAAWRRADTPENGCGVDRTRSEVSAKGLAPLLLHFDVNKTVIQSDSIQTKTIEEGIREGIAELFWGTTRREGDRVVWEWARGPPSCNAPTTLDGGDPALLVNYAQYCKMILKDKDERKQAVKSFRFVTADEPRQEMDKLLRVTLKMMQLPDGVRFTELAEAAGLKGATHLMFPTIFHLVASLQQSRRKFAILFRSFGSDHDQIKIEWNAFCEMKHPVFSKLLQGVGPLDGTTPGVPDRRIQDGGLHTIYRDADGPMLMIGAFTNGPEDRPWDAWARQKPRPETDTRGGRAYIRDTLAAETAEGFDAIQDWMKCHLFEQRTAAIKDDWAWWMWNGEIADAGKLLCQIGSPETRQLFFDDNIEANDARIVDCRDPEGNMIPAEACINRLCTKVNPVEALLDKEYFLRKVQACLGEHLDMGNSLLNFQRQLTEVEELKVLLERQVKTLNLQLKNMTEENRRMKLKNRLRIPDEGSLQEVLLAHEFDLNVFGKDGLRSVSELFEELEQGQCWLEEDHEGEGQSGLQRVFEMVFVKVRYKDLILVESHEQDSESRIQSRNYLPGRRKTLREPSFADALDSWLEAGLGVDLKNSGCIICEKMPVFTPDAPSQETKATQAFPIPCKLHQSEAEYVIPEMALVTHRELLKKIGLPEGKHFTTTEKDLSGTTVTRFLRWDRSATWEATLTQKGNTTVSQVDMNQMCKQLFQNHPRREVYENLLLQMFETFTAKKLAGGFSGSLVIRVQPFEHDGRPGEPCIVKMDAEDAIQAEFENSVHVFQTLPDRAARIIGDPVFSTDKNDGEAFGAMRLELAGACWNVPELAQGSANLLSTFKDLLLFESEQVLLGRTATAAQDARPFGNVNSVLAETFGPGGVVSSLRKGGRGMRREAEKPLTSWYTLKGKKTKFNLFNADENQYPPGKAIRQLYKTYFGEEMPNLMELVEGNIKPQLEALGRSGHKELLPLVGLAHGDLNAANIMIDALDAVWLIDFATSVDLPLFTDMCKFEMACLFEYSLIPITPEMLLDFASDREDMWTFLNVGDWLRVDQSVADKLLRTLRQRRQDKSLHLVTQDELQGIIASIAAAEEEKEAKKIVRALQSRLTARSKDTEGAFAFCQLATKALCSGDYVFDTLSIKSPSSADGCGRGASSVRWFMDHAVGVRRFMSRDMLATFREFSPGSGLPIEGLEPCDASSLQLWLPFLRETYRILGYRDIAPQHKMWSIYHCHLVAQSILRVLANMNEAIASNNLCSLPIMHQLSGEGNAKKARPSLNSLTEKLATPNQFTEADSIWVHANSRLFQQTDVSSRRIRHAHTACAKYSRQAGLFAPILRVSEVLKRDPKERRSLRETERTLTMCFVSAEEEDDEDDQQQPAEQWTLHVHVAEDFDPVFSEPLLDNSLVDGCIGTVTPGRDTEAPKVRMYSRLFFATTGLLQSNIFIIKSNLFGEVQDGDESPKRSRWWGNSSAAVSSLNVASLTPHRSMERKKSKDRNVDAALSKDPIFTMDNTEQFQRSLTLQAVARNALGEDMMQCTIDIGVAAMCYPPGAALCLDVPEGCNQAPPSTEVVVMREDGFGVYQVRAAGADPTEDTDFIFEPFASNHVFLTPCTYEEQRRILVSEGGGSWADATVIEAAKEKTGFRHRVRIKSATQESPQNGWMTKESLEVVDQAESKALRYLTAMNSGPSLISAGTYEEEVHKIKLYTRARCSFIIDALSGQRLPIQSCATPTLRVVAYAGCGEEEMVHQIGRRGSQGGMTGSLSWVGAVGSSQDRSDAPGTPNKYKFFPRTFSRKASVTSQSGFEGALPQANTMETKGWQLILHTVDRYQKAVPSCYPSAFLIVGAPGSGKTALTHRLVMDCLDRHRDLVPVLLMVADIVKRSGMDDATQGEALDMDPATVRVWFDKYLRLIFGEDSLRYKMVRQAMSMRRVMFFFEGLEDGGPMMHVVEGLIRDIVIGRHLVVVTSRQLRPGQSSLDSLSDHITTMELRSLTDQQIRSVAHARLGLNGLNKFDEVMRALRTGGDQKKSTQEHADEEHGNVFGNPMMLSMLICYCNLEPNSDSERTDKEANRKDNKAQTEKGDNVTLTAVYRVAIDVMLQRVQSRQQGDRHKKEQNVSKCKRVLEFMAKAMTMQEEGRATICAEEFETLLPEEMSEGWDILKGAVEAGYAMVLRSQIDGGRREYNFLARVFQNFFAASEIHTVHTEGGTLMEKSVALKTLLTKQRWAHILEMLAEAWPLTYVKLIESRLENFQVEGDNTFLHLAAQHGHNPVFRLLQHFSEQNKNALFVKNSRRMTPLHLASERGHTKICELMVSLKADLDAEDEGGRMPLHVAMQNGKFHTAGYLVELYENRSMFKPGSRRGFRERGSICLQTHPAEELALRVLSLPGSGGSLEPLSEDEFMRAAAGIFIELGFFRDKDKLDMDNKKRSMGSLLSVFWICGDHYESFVRCQKSDDTRLTRESWDSLQRWTKTTGLTQDPNTVVAMLVSLAISQLGKIKPFKEAFAPEKGDDHVEVMRSILESKPILVPSVSKLGENLRQLILRSTVEFNFGQFIQAENLPASIMPVKDMISTADEKNDEKDRVLGFFLWQTFAKMCGVLGHLRIDGSLLIIDKFWKNFEDGVNVLQYLTSESPQMVYDRFLAKRAVAQGLPFDEKDSDSRALVRLACLSRTYDSKTGGEVAEAWRELAPEERQELAMYLNADGIRQKAIILYNAPRLLEHCRQEADGVGLVLAMRMLLRVYKLAYETFSFSDSLVVTVMVDEVFEQAKICTATRRGDLLDDDSDNDEEDHQRHKERLAEKFDFTPLEITRTTSDNQGAIHRLPWQLVTDPEQLASLADRADNLVVDMDRGIREPAFTRRLPEVFPELCFFRRADEDIHKRTRCALLAVYFAWSDQVDAFSRGQAVDKRISEKSWGKIQHWIEAMSDVDSDGKDFLHVVLVAVVVFGVAKIPKFQSQLAPGAKNHRETVKCVLDKCPKVLPSYSRLHPRQRSLLHKCLVCEFDFEQFLLAESLPASLAAVSVMLQEPPCTQDERKQLLLVFLFVIFAWMSGSEGERSEEGSVYMTEERFLKFSAGVEAVLLLEEDGRERAAYGQLLRARAEALEMDLEKHKDRAIVRLACMAQVSNVLDLVPITDAFKALDKGEQEALTRYLNADAIDETPGFVMRDMSAFLEIARTNDEVGLTDAIKILLKVYEEAWKEYHWGDASLVYVNLGKLTCFAKDFFGSARFQDVPFELHMDEAASEAVVIPKVWIPITDTAELNKLTHQSTQLARELLQHQVKEEAFRARVGRVFPELSYFSGTTSIQREQTMGALLSVYWLLNGQHEAFTRGQTQDPLSQQSWAWIQEWMAKTVKLSSEEAVDATLVFMAIHALGKIREFREECAPGYDKHMHDTALAHILNANPEVVPSFKRLSKKYKKLILDSLNVDFEFSHFLQAETTPANLVVVQETFRPHGADGFAFFCFRVFAQMCGKLGLNNGQGSLFMNDRQFQRFKPGLDALQQLLGTGDVAETYNKFLLQRSTKAMSRFASLEQRALARLLCLSNAYDWKGGRSICDAFDALTKDEREDLTRCLNMDGINSTPGYSLVGATELLSNAEANRAVGLPAALRMLIRVQEECSRQTDDECSKVVVHLDTLAAWSKDVLPDSFREADVVLLSDDYVPGETRVVTVGVERKAVRSPGRGLTGDTGEVSEFATTLAPPSLPEARSEELPFDDGDLIAPLQARTVSSILAASSLGLMLLALLMQGTLGSEGWAHDVEAAMLVVAMLLAVVVAFCLYSSCQDNRREMQSLLRDGGQDSADASGPGAPFVPDRWSMTPRRRRQDGHDYMPLQQRDDVV